MSAQKVKAAGNYKYLKIAMCKRIFFIMEMYFGCINQN